MTANISYLNYCRRDKMQLKNDLQKETRKKEEFYLKILLFFFNFVIYKFEFNF